ncbi:MAG: hypothetical protein HYY62_00710, partial [Deltaproteobacteria bacterium]|nr:hypothetical protein [Deltaproteobacteria bacterium]
MKTLVALLILTLMMGCAQKDSPEQVPPTPPQVSEQPKAPDTPEATVAKITLPDVEGTNITKLYTYLLSLKNQSHTEMLFSAASAFEKALELDDKGIKLENFKKAYDTIHSVGQWEGKKAIWGYPGLEAIEKTQVFLLSGLDFDKTIEIYEFLRTLRYKYYSAAEGVSLYDGKEAFEKAEELARGGKFETIKTYYTYFEKQYGFKLAFDKAEKLASLNIDFEKFKIAFEKISRETFIQHGNWQSYRKAIEEAFEKTITDMNAPVVITPDPAPAPEMAAPAPAPTPVEVVPPTVPLPLPVLEEQPRQEEPAPRSPENEQAFQILKTKLGTVTEVKNFENLDLSKSMIILIAHNVALSFSYIPARETLGVEKGIVTFDSTSKKAYLKFKQEAIEDSEKNKQPIIWLDETMPAGTRLEVIKS